MNTARLPLTSFKTDEPLADLLAKPHNPLSEGPIQPAKNPRTVVSIHTANGWITVADVHDIDYNDHS